MTMTKAAMANRSALRAEIERKLRARGVSFRYLNPGQMLIMYRGHRYELYVLSGKWRERPTGAYMTKTYTGGIDALLLHGAQETITV